MHLESKRKRKERSECESAKKRASDSLLNGKRGQDSRSLESRSSVLKSFKILLSNGNKQKLPQRVLELKKSKLKLLTVLAARAILVV